jgi:hypothetical protein
MSTTAHQQFWKNRDAAAYAKGMRYRSGHACGGNSYHRTKEAAERAAKRKARRACPENPPCWYVDTLKQPTEA